MAVSPMPRSSVKMKKPTSAPPRPSRMVAKKPMGSLPGISARARKPARMPRMMAPIMEPIYSSRVTCLQGASRGAGRGGAR